MFVACPGGIRRTPLKECGCFPNGRRYKHCTVTGCEQNHRIVEVDTAARIQSTIGNWKSNGFTILASNDC